MAAKNKEKNRKKKEAPGEEKLRLAAVFPIAILLAVCAMQYLLVQTRGLTPWKGGGFGLFSTIDKGDNRAVACLAQDTEGRLCRIVMTPRELSGAGFERDWFFKLLSYPQPERLKDLGSRLLAAEFQRAPSPRELVKRFPFDPSGRLHFKSLERQPFPLRMLTARTASRIPPEQRVRLRALRLSVWRWQFDPETTQMKWQSVGESVELGKTT